MTEHRGGCAVPPAPDRAAEAQVVLRRMGPEDLDQLERVSAMPSVAARDGAPPDPDGFDDFGPGRSYREPRPCSLEDQGALVVEVDGQVGGSVSWIWREWGPNSGSRCLMIGVHLDARFRGRGIGSRAPAMLVDLAFRHTTVHRIEAHTDVQNVPAQRALEAIGFTREGVTRAAQWRDGAYRDGILYAILRTDSRPPLR